jgi:hypothetical protein
MGAALGMAAAALMMAVPIASSSLGGNAQSTVAGRGGGHNAVYSQPTVGGMIVGATVTFTPSTKLATTRAAPVVRAPHR